MGTQLDFFDGVKEFNVAAGVIQQFGQPFDPKLVAFYTGMQCEELAEKLVAVFDKNALVTVEGVKVPVSTIILSMEALGQEMKDNLHTERFVSANRQELLDADVDIQVVSEGSILAAGANGFGARAEVNRSNLAKIVDGKVIRDPVSGKILKPEGWTPPNLAPFFNPN